MRGVSGSSEWTRGIVGSVYLAVTPAQTVAIDHLSPTILSVIDLPSVIGAVRCLNRSLCNRRYKGAFPTEVLKDDGTHSFEVNVTAHLTAAEGSGGSGTLEVAGAWGGSKSVPVMLTAGDNGTKVVSVVLPAARSQAIFQLLLSYGPSLTDCL